MEPGGDPRLGLRFRMKTGAPCRSPTGRPGRRSSELRRTPWARGGDGIDDGTHAAPVDEAAAQAFDKIIAEQQEATRHLAEILRSDMRDIAVLQRERGEEVAKAAKGRKFYQSYW